MVETEQALKHSVRHSAAVSDVNLPEVDFEAVVTAVGVAVVESPHSLVVVVIGTVAASVFPNRFVAVDLSTASHAPWINYSHCLLFDLWNRKYE